MRVTSHGNSRSHIILRPALRFLAWLALLGALTEAAAQEARRSTGSQTPRPKRLLLLGQSPDSHPFATHEYMAGVDLFAKLAQRNGLQVIVVNADEPWKEGPEQLDGADGVVLFLSEGARWLRNDPARLAAFRRLGRRGGGLSVLHWGMGTRDAGPIGDFVSLFGGCHGGPDRRYEVVSARVSPASKHPILTGLAPFQIEDEFYFALKFPGPDSTVVKTDDRVTPLLRVPIGGGEHTVAWAWTRPDGGRSFGFTGGHFHKNWQREEYRRLVTQGLLWTLKQPIPLEGANVEVKEEDLRLKPRR